MTSLTAALVVPAQAELVISSGSDSSTVRAVGSVNKGQQLTHTQTTPSDASVLKLMQVMHVDEQIEAIVNSQQAMADILEQQGDKTSVDDKKLNKRQREMAQSMQGVLEQYTKILAGGIQGTATKEEMVEAYKAAAKAHYTQQEVSALIDFYDTPMGQSILEKNPKVTSQFLKASLPDEGEMRQTTKQLEELMPQIKDIFKGIF
ncbi:DUF2059 domain-containing protein [Psychrobacter phenylpyruvicus]|nr:DUF2059 domain-containing protein [Psychrobacter phenylpyruvicus]